MKAIQAEDLCYTYEDGTVALDHITFAAEQGKVTGILGANGAGKSTLFLSLNGVLTPKSGKVLLGGQPVRYDKKGLLELRRRVGIVFQDPDDQLFSADVYRDVSFGGVNLGLPAEEVRRRVEGALDRTGVSHLRDKPTHALSYGQKKRVAIAGVLVMEPEVLILDEPTAGLDPQGVSDIMRLLTRLRDELGMTVLIATHDMDIVPLYCDYAYLLGGGKVLLEGTPEQLFADPAALRSGRPGGRSCECSRRKTNERNVVRRGGWPRRSRAHHQEGRAHHPPGGGAGRARRGPRGKDRPQYRRGAGRR